LENCFEKIIINRLQASRTGLEEDQIQFGFRKGRSIQDALNKFYKGIKEANGKYVIAIFIDIKEAFDNLWWPALYVILKKIGIPNYLIRVLGDYCENRIVNLCAT